MSLNDWHKILNELSELVGDYVKNPFRQPTETVRQIDNTNFELHIQWMDLDALVYSKLLPSVDFNLVFPFVIKVKVAVRSNVDEFIPDSSVRKTTPKQKTTADKSSLRSIVSKTKDDSGNSIKLRECCVRLPLLRFDENGEVIQNDVIRNKRKHSSIVADESRLVKITPKIRNESNELFMLSSSSTPFARNGFDAALKTIGNEIHGSHSISSQKTVKRLTNRLTTTPRTSNDRGTGSQFIPRIRLLNMPENIIRSKKLKPKNTNKKQKKAHTKSTSTKRLKPKAQSVANETELFEVPVENQKIKKKTKKKSSSLAQNIIKEEER